MALSVATCGGPGFDVGKPANVATDDVVIVAAAGVGMQRPDRPHGAQANAPRSLFSTGCS